MKKLLRNLSLVSLIALCSSIGVRADELDQTIENLENAILYQDVTTRSPEGNKEEIKNQFRNLMDLDNRYRTSIGVSLRSMLSETFEEEFKVAMPEKAMPKNHEMISYVTNMVDLFFAVKDFNLERAKHAKAYLYAFKKMPSVRALREIGVEDIDLPSSSDPKKGGW